MNKVMTRSAPSWRRASRTFGVTTSASVLALAASALLGAAPASAQATQYTYGGMGRLTQVAYATGLITTCSYDAAGNRTQVASSGASNRLPTAADNTVTILAGQSIDIAVRDNDSDPYGGNLTVISASAVTSGGTATIEGGGTFVRYTAPTTPGAKSFTCNVSNGRGVRNVEF